MLFELDLWQDLYWFYLVCITQVIYMSHGMMSVLYCSWDIAASNWHPGWLSCQRRISLIQHVLDKSMFPVFFLTPSYSLVAYKCLSEKKQNKTKQKYCPGIFEGKTVQGLFWTFSQRDAVPFWSVTLWLPSLYPQGILLSFINSLT